MFAIGFFPSPETLPSLAFWGTKPYWLFSLILADPSQILPCFFSSPLPINIEESQELVLGILLFSIYIYSCNNLIESCDLIYMVITFIYKSRAWLIS